ncbi:2-hydroxy-3-keto-5-methylthiopentenyl-1-phosphate phosphatase [Paenibacillus sp. J31TS4]|uniref:2-hydroxy-3-keto-5-methylthiopentenyl-1- phosphate phosphatase n=1 Tax=Paenibacillus sp. J31TS4 TaxID=2807195 RepID=UPI001B102CCB|nr:2-hydroxy-3-keto-5-methylthiopentenyl-1-phosphate phosphatase [Paenibacillus sp. J31TS4]GIP37419.1 2-hydroxy-3-keto-5-methylthiopentenyl-1-phosphate phosphatase [Paenibacillus sp. J31TS4]
MTTRSGKKPIVFCDFDGTITVNDNIVEIMKHFHPPGYEKLMAQVTRREMSVREGVGRMFALLRSDQKEEIVAFAKASIRIREGFPELLAYCKEKDIDFLVTSGGIDFFLLPALEPFDLKPEQIYCNASDFSGEHIKVTWPHPCDEECDNNGGCGMCKTTIIRSYPSARYVKFMIGDSISDFPGSKQVDYIFARSHLAEECRSLGMPYMGYETFHDVIRQLDQLLAKEVF